MTTEAKGRRRKDKGRSKKEIIDRVQKEREQLIDKKDFLARSEEDLNEKEIKAGNDLEVADEVLNEASAKSNDALSSTPINKNSVTVAKMMLDTAKKKCEKAMDCLDSVRKQKKSLDKTTHKLFDKGLSSTEMGQKWKSDNEEPSNKKVKTGQDQTKM